jgi:hypothetical protein
MNHKAILLPVAAAALALFTGLARAQADDASWHVVACGGGESDAAGFELMGTIGEAVVLVSADGAGQLELSGGFWTVEGGCGGADFNCDGAVGTDADIEAFFACLGGTCPPPPCRSSADFNGDGAVGTDADIEAFFRVLGGGSC